MVITLQKCFHSINQYSNNKNTCSIYTCATEEAAYETAYFVCTDRKEAVKTVGGEDLDGAEATEVAPVITVRCGDYVCVVVPNVFSDDHLRPVS